MFLTGFCDEVSSDPRRQLDACRFLKWKHIDLRTVGDKNICHLNDKEIDSLLMKLNDEDIQPVSFGSPIANWSRPISYSLKDEIKELEYAAGLMKKCKVTGIRIMSYKTDRQLSASDPFGEEVLKRLKELTVVAEYQGITLLHENCETWGGQSHEHTLFLIDQIDSPSFRLIFDTGNPPGLFDVRGTGPYGYQNALDFLKAVYEHVEIVHIKDARMDSHNLVYTWPGEGQGYIPEILEFLKQKDFGGPFSIEPHLAVVFHDDSVKSDDKMRWDSFIEYARRSRDLLTQAGFQ